MNYKTSFIVIGIVMGECTMLYYKKYGFKVCVILFDFYSTHYKVYIHIPCITTQQQTRAPFDSTNILLFSECQTPILYQGFDNHCEGYCNSDIIHPLQLYLTIHYCNQSVLAIVPDLNIFI